MANIKSTGFQVIDQSSAELKALSTFLHDNPELAFKEYKAHDYICDFLERKQFKVERHFILETGFQAVYETASRPHVVLLVEYDALSNVGHACGHNLIAECSVAAGLGLMEIMKSHNLKGKLTLLGTPAEESGGGKINFVSNNFFHDVDAAMMSHPSHTNVCHSPRLCVAEYCIRYRGKEAHAACAPWDGINALDAAVLAYQSLSCLRQQINPDCRIHGIITNGGVAINMIPNLTEMKYEVRAPTKKMLKELLVKVFACFESASVSTGCKLEMEELSPIYENLNSNNTLIDLYENNAKSLSVNFQRKSETSSGSTDAGNVSNACPTIHPSYFIGSNAEAHTVEFATAAGSEEAQQHVLTQAKIMMGALTDVLCDETCQLVKTMRKEFEESIQNN